MYILIGLLLLTIINPFMWVGYFIFTLKSKLSIAIYLIYNVLIQLICYPFYEVLLKSSDHKHVSLKYTIFISLAISAFLIVFKITNNRNKEV